MPLYEYQCKKCHSLTERIQKFSDSPMTTCPHCGGDSRKTGERYRDEGYLAVETMQRIDRLRSAAEDRALREADE